MKKYLIFILLLLAFPFVINAKTDVKSLKTMNLDEALTQENIEHDFSKYKETDDQVTIYLFRGNGCGYCRNFLTFLNSIVDEYGEMFKVVSFEVWYDEANANFLEEIAIFTNSMPSDPTKLGVPFIVIGDQVFPGYDASFNDQIIEKIKSEYNSKKKYDVLEKYEKGEKAGLSSTTVIIIWLCVLTAIMLVTILGFINVKHKELLDEIDSLKENYIAKEPKELPVEVEKELAEDYKEIPEKNEVKKTTKNKK